MLAFGAASAYLANDRLGSCVEFEESRNQIDLHKLSTKGKDLTISVLSSFSSVLANAKRYCTSSSLGIRFSGKREVTIEDQLPLTCWIYKRCYGRRSEHSSFKPDEYWRVGRTGCVLLYTRTFDGAWLQGRAIKVRFTSLRFHQSRSESFGEICPIPDRSHLRISTISIIQYPLIQSLHSPSNARNTPL